MVALERPQPVAGDLRGHGAEHEAGCGRELSSAVRGTLMAPGSVDTNQEAALSPRGSWQG